MKPPFDLYGSAESRFTEHRARFSDRSVCIATQRFRCTRLGVVNPPSSALSLALAAAVGRVRRRLVALLAGPPKGGL